MKLENITNDITEWIKNVVELDRPELNGISVCPFAKQSRLNQNIDICIGDEIEKDLFRVMDKGMQSKEVIILVYAPDQYSASEVDRQVTHANQEILGPHDLIALTDHPDDVEEILGIHLNQGKYILVFVQQLSKLNQASQVLAKQGFYKGWSPEYLKDLFRFREIPNNLDI